MSRKSNSRRRASCFQHRPLVLALCAALPLLAMHSAFAAPYNIANVPLAVGGSLEPNLMYVHDDSGSMYWSFLPDGIGKGYQRGTSVSYNLQYYNPDAVYLPPVDEEGNSLGNATFTSAWFDGYNLAGRATNTVNLSNSFRATWGYAGDWVNTTGERAFYHVFSPPRTNCTTAAQMVTSNNNCYVKVVLPAAQEQNFANWYSYYRTRAYSSKAGISRAFATIDGGIRVGYGRINKGTNSTIDGKSLPVIIRGVRAFEGTNRKDFYDWLFGVVSSGGTPLRRSLNAAGQYFENDHATGPWSTTPGVTGGNHLSCRKSFTILMTDGDWNGSFSGLANVDNTGGPTITGPNSQSFTYVAKSPFNDDHSTTLADVAMHYWKRDLSSLPNRVPTTARNPAFWQHMVTLPIGFGVVGTVSKNAAFDAITSGATITWPAPTTSGGKVDDLLHAGVNSRGDYFSANNPQEFEEELKRALAAVNAQVGSGSGAVVSSPNLDTDTLIYKALFDSADWTGKYLAYEFDSNGKIKPNHKWEASEQIPAHGSRKIFTWRTDEERGADFLLGDLSTPQREWLNDSADLVNYLRGDKSKEGTGAGQFRPRNSLLGDIVNSSAAFVGTEDFGYGNATGLPLAQRNAYKSRRDSGSYKGRSKTIYVGANDGMLHAFDAMTGVERFAYVPNVLLNNFKLAGLADKGYTHNYFVDGSPRTADAFLDGSWRTVLVGSTGAGGRAYFALDVDNATTFNKSNVLWEFTHPELGYAIGQASIVRTESGQWVAIFGNGYNSDSHRAQLFIVDLKSGALLKQFDTGVGTAANPNGLSRPAVIDSDLNGNADLVYAGDMQGNLWKFDISGNQADWSIAFESGGSPRPLFKAESATGAVQPIQGAPQAGRFAARGKPEIMVYFGSGKYFEVGDQGATNPVNSLYGLIDECGVKFLAPGSPNSSRPGGCDTASGVAKVLRSNLREQKIILEQMNQSFTNEDGETYNHDIRLVSNNSLSASDKGFYLDLKPPVGPQQGERYIGQPRLTRDRVQYVTMVPDPDPCSAGGVSWFMELDPVSGGRTKHSVFDLNKDGDFNQNEFVTNPDNPSEKIPVSGRRNAGGIVSDPVAEVGDQECWTDYSGQLVCDDVVTEPEGRRSWRQIR